MRERSDKLVREVVLSDAAPFVPLVIDKRGRDTEYGAKAVTLGGARYIVCINHQEAAKDAAERTAILAALERQLRRGDKALVGNTGFRRFLKTVGKDHFAIDRSKADEDARFDGVFVLRTNTDLNPLAAMLRYKQLWAVEQTFRTAKHLLATQPIFTSSTRRLWTSYQWSRRKWQRGRSPRRQRHSLSGTINRSDGGAGKA